MSPASAFETLVIPTRCHSTFFARTSPHSRTASWSCFGGRVHSMAELCKHALLETIYKETHVKPVVDSLLEQRRVELARTGRSYEERVLRLAEQSLF